MDIILTYLNIFVLTFTLNKNILVYLKKKKKTKKIKKKTKKNDRKRFKLQRCRKLK